MIIQCIEGKPYFQNLCHNLVNKQLHSTHIAQYLNNIENKRETFFFKNQAENETERLFPDLFLFFFFKKKL